MKSVFWVADSKKRLLTFPANVRREIGFVLEGAQAGLTHHKAKPLRRFSGVYEIVSNYDRDTYRAIYAVNLGEMIYVLHCFQKKSKFRIKTPKKEIDLIRKRLNSAKELAQKENEND
jgi:phage-related protein